MCRRIGRKSPLVGKIVPFRSPLEALGFLRRGDRPVVDLVLLDINMPEMDGYGFLDRAVAEFGVQFARVVAVMLTVPIQSEDERRLLQYSVVRHFVNKPLSERDIEVIAAGASGFEGVSSGAG